MYRFSKIIEWGYLFVGIVFAIQVFANWQIDRQKALVSILMTCLAIFMFVFKRRFRQKRTKK